MKDTKKMTDTLLEVLKKGIKKQFEAATVDVEAIYNEIHKDAVDAYYSSNPYEIHKEENGLDFAISLDEAKKLVTENQESFTIP